MPALDETLTKYLSTTKPLLTPEEYDHTVAVVEDFKAGIGQKLQAMLEERGRDERNWVRNPRGLFNGKNTWLHAPYASAHPADVLRWSFPALPCPVNVTARGVVGAVCVPEAALSHRREY